MSEPLQGPGPKPTEPRLQSPRALTCSPKAPLEQRDLLNGEEAGRLERLFKVLGNTTRLRLLHALVREPELDVGALADAVEMKPQAVSNQLQRLAYSGIVVARREGNHMHYQVVDPCVRGLLELALCLDEDMEAVATMPVCEEAS